MKKLFYLLLIFFSAVCAQAQTTPTTIKVTPYTGSNTSARVIYDKSGVEAYVTNALKPINLFMAAQAKTNDSLRRTNADLIKQLTIANAAILKLQQQDSLYLNYDRPGFISTHYMLIGRCDSADYSISLLNGKFDNIDSSIKLLQNQTFPVNPKGLKVDATGMLIAQFFYNDATKTIDRNY